MGRQPGVYTTTETRRTRMAAPDDIEVRNSLLKRKLRDTAALDIEGYTRAFWEAVSEPEWTLVLYKRLGSNAAIANVKKAEYSRGDVEPADMETTVFQAFGSGAYYVQPKLMGRFYAPGSRVFRLGDDEGAVSSFASAPSEDVDRIIGSMGRQLAAVNVVRELKRMQAESAKEDDDTMKPADLAQLAAAFRPAGPDPVMLKMLELSEQRAAQAEARADKMFERFDTSRREERQGSLPLIAEVIKSLKPETADALSRLMAPADAPDGGWKPSDVMEMIHAAIPVLQQVVGAFLSQLRPTAPALPAPAPVAASADGLAGVASGSDTNGGSPMPLALTPEQQFAAEMIVEWVEAGAFADAWATLEATPGFDAIVARVTPGVSPRAYLPVLYAVMPALKAQGARVEAWIAWGQAKLKADEAPESPEGPVEIITE